MTDGEWRAGTDPVLMLRQVWDRATAREVRLFFCAWANAVRHRMPGADCRRAVGAAERFADGLADRAQLRAAAAAADAGWRAARAAARGRRARADIRQQGARAAYEAADVARLAAAPGWDLRAVCQFLLFRRGGATRALPGLLRDVFGPPAGPPAVDPGWVTPTAAALAAGIYADGAWDRLPVLADALEDAGCDAADLLAHLRGPGPHVRGCWAVDLVLGNG